MPSRLAPHRPSASAARQAGHKQSAYSRRNFSSTSAGTATFTHQQRSPAHTNAPPHRGHFFSTAPPLLAPPRDISAEPASIVHPSKTARRQSTTSQDTLTHPAGGLGNEWGITYCYIYYSKQNMPIDRLGDSGLELIAGGFVLGGGVFHDVGGEGGGEESERRPAIEKRLRSAICYGIVGWMSLKLGMDWNRGARGESDGW
jgi:hypothetical protein